MSVIILRHSYEEGPDLCNYLRAAELRCIVFNTGWASAAYYYGKKRKLSKPTGGEEAGEGDLAKPARRRKKRKAIFVQKKRRSSAVDYAPASSPQVSEHASDDSCAQVCTGVYGAAAECEQFQPTNNEDGKSSQKTLSVQRRQLEFRAENIDKSCRPDGFI